MTIEPIGADPKISVIIPYYNNHTTIVDTLVSISEQTYPNIETILINDGSTKKSSKVLKSILLKNKNILYVQQKNRGVATARNTGVMFSSGEYLLFLDADDIIKPTYIAECIKKLQEDAETKLVYSEAELFGAIQGKWELPEYAGFTSLLMGNMIPCIAIHRATDFFDLGGFDESLRSHEDWDLWIRMLAKGGEVYRIPESLFLYRKRPEGNSLTDDLLRYPEKIVQDWQKVYHKNSDIYVKNNLGFSHLMQVIKNI